VTEGRDSGISASLPEEFVENVKDALEHLYDLGYLQRHPLARDGLLAGTGGTEIAAQSLRREIASAVEALNPGPAVSFHAVGARIFNLLSHHYMQGLTVRETARALSISERHAYRGLREGERLVAEIVWNRRHSRPDVRPAATPRGSLAIEVASLPPITQTVDLSALLASALEAVQPLADQRSVAIRIVAEQSHSVVVANPMLAEQLLIALLTQAVEQACPDGVQVSVTGDHPPTVTLRHGLAAEAPSSAPLGRLVDQLAGQLDWSILQDGGSGERVVTVRAPDRQFTVLVVDDNEGLVELFERYLTKCPARVIAASNGEEGLRLAKEKEPEVIVLDVMMPGLHGWQVLQRLRDHPVTQDIPVVVCSVITIPELAQALGAVLFLPKPVSQAQLLGAFSQLGLL
jgi:CheY-like chemotaxis protein